MSRNALANLLNNKYNNNTITMPFGNTIGENILN